MSPLLIVLPTGGGKSLVYEALAAQAADVTIVISPFKALAQDIAVRTAANGISSTLWGGKSTPHVAIVVVVADTATSADFLHWLHAYVCRTNAA